MAATRRCLVGTPRDTKPEPQLPQPCARHSPECGPTDRTALGEALRQLTGSEIKAHCYLFPHEFNAGPVNLDRTINTCGAGLRLSESLGFGMGILQLGAYLSKFPLSPFLFFIPLPTFSDLYHPKEGQRFALPLCSWSTPWLG